MPSVTGSSRTYVPPRRGLARRVRRVTVAVPVPAAGGALLAAGVTLATVLSAFVAAGASRLERTTWLEVGLLLAGGACAAAALVLPRRAGTPEKLRGGWALLAFALLAALTAASITWSLTPDPTWLETTRTLAYLATFAGALALGRLFPAGWRAVLAGTMASAAIICGWALLTKILPAAVAPDETLARLRAPFGYWNSLGLTAALGIPALLWLAVRRSGHAAVNSLAWPGLGLLTVCMLLSYSRGSLIALGIGLAVWLAVVPLRLRALTALGGVLVVTLPVVVWAFAQDGLSKDGAPLSMRVDAGLALGAMLLLMLVALTAAGLAVGFLTAHHPPAAATRVRVTRALVVVLAAVPAVAILMLANAPGGVSGQVSKAWHRATDPNAAPPDNSPDRLAATSSVRARYWSEAWKVHEQNPWLGSGPGSYPTQRLRYRIDRVEVQHAHGYLPQVLSDLGWAGIAASVLATLTWLLAAVRAIGMRRRDRGSPWDAERVAVASLATVVLVFGIHSAIDWTWYIPGNVVPALICAGFVAARGPLRERLALAATTRPPFGRAPAAERVGVARPAIAVVVAALAAVAAWSALQPVRAAHAETAAYQRFDRGELPQAVSIARIAHQRNPLALEPLWDIAAFEQARGDAGAAKSALEEAVRLEPANPEPWRRLGRFQLLALNDPNAAVKSFGAAFYLDKRSAQSVSDLIIAVRAAAGG